MKLRWENCFALHVLLYSLFVESLWFMNLIFRKKSKVNDSGSINGGILLVCGHPPFVEDGLE